MRADWAAMVGNDVPTVAQCYLAKSVRIFRPQSTELSTARSVFATIIPATSSQRRARFDPLSLLAERRLAVTEARIVDDNVTAWSGPLHRVAAGQIVEQIEDVPDDDTAAAWQSPWVTTGVPDRG